MKNSKRILSMIYDCVFGTAMFLGVTTAPQTAITAIAAESDSVDYISEARTLSEILADTRPDEASVRNALKDIPSPYHTTYNYSAFYTKGLSSDFIVIYNTRDMDLRGILATPNGKLWVENYAKYLTALADMTGLHRDYLAFVINTDIPVDANIAGSTFSNGSGFHISGKTAISQTVCGMMNNKFVHTLLHETSHMYDNNKNDYNNKLKNHDAEPNVDIFHTDEEVMVEFRMDCALHWAGLDADKIELVNATSRWIRTDVPEQYRYHESDKISLFDPECSQYIPSNSVLLTYQDIKSVPISHRQYLASTGYADTSNSDGYCKVYSRPASIFNNTVINAPVTFSASPDPNDSNNWLNTDAIDANWNTVTDEEWAKLSVLFVVDANEVQLPNYGEDIANYWNEYYGRCSDKITYGKNNNLTTVKVTPQVHEWLYANYSDNRNAEGTYYMTGSMIQALNVCDYMNIDLNTALFYNTNYAPDTKLIDFYMEVLSPELNHSHLYTLTATTPTITAQPVDAHAYIGDTAVFSVTAAGDGLSYQWQYNNGSGWKNSTAAGARTNCVSIAVTAARNGQQYRCIVSNADGERETSVPAAIKTLVKITEQPVDVSAYIGDTAVFSVTAAGNDLSYQWQYNNGSGWKNSTAAGAQTNCVSIAVTAARNGQQYRCIVSNADGERETSAAAAIKTLVKITEQPVDVSAYIGDTAVFSVTATGNDLSYQWQYNNGSGWKNSTAAGAQTNCVRIAVTAARNGQQYRCIVSNADGERETSAAATMRTLLKITSQPQSQSGSVGDTLNFSVTASGAGLTYQWQYYNTTSKKWVNTTLPGNQTAALHVLVKANYNNRKYRCKITDANGTVLNSANAVLTVLFPLGDVDLNGIVEQADATLLADYIGEDPDAVITNTGLINADVNQDGILNMIDVELIMQMIG